MNQQQSIKELKKLVDLIENSCDGMSEEDFAEIEEIVRIDMIKELAGIKDDGK